MRPNGSNASKLRTETKSLITTAAVTAGTAGLFFALDALRKIPAVAEWGATHISAAYTAVMGRLMSVIPFSVFEPGVIIAVAGGMALVVFGIIGLVKKRWYDVLSGLIAVVFTVFCVLNLYTLTAGFAYYRDDPPVPVSEREYTSDEVVAAAQYFLDDFSALSDSFERDENGCVVSPYSLRELSDKIAAEYERLDDGYFYSYTPRAKGMLNSWLLSDLRLTGVTFLPLAEPNVNSSVPPSGIAQTMAHEMAHAKGVAREGDANFVSYYLLLSSDDAYLRYCGYYACFSSMISAVLISGADEEIAQSITYPEAVVAEYRYENSYWNAQPDILGRISEFFNDLYLKLNGADNGTGSYNDPGDWDIIDTGEVDDDGRPVVKPVYSDLMKLYFALYEQAA